MWAHVWIDFKELLRLPETLIEFFLVSISGQRIIRAVNDRDVSTDGFPGTYRWSQK